MAARCETSEPSGSTAFHSGKSELVTIGLCCATTDDQARKRAACSWVGPAAQGRYHLSEIDRCGSSQLFIGDFFCRSDHGR